MNKFLHAPSVRLRAAAANGRGLAVVDTARYLFGLDDSLPPAAAGPAAGPGSDDASERTAEGDGGPKKRPSAPGAISESRDERGAP